MRGLLSSGAPPMADEVRSTPSTARLRDHATAITVVVVAASLVRLIVWLLLPAARFASDEEGYFRAGMTLLTTGVQDVFWPPGTGWLIAATAWAFRSVEPPTIRLVWIAMDIACVFAICVLAHRVAVQVTGDTVKRRQVLTLAGLGYAFYLPAISFAQFTTSETPALLLLLVALMLLSRERGTWLAFVGAGGLLGAMAITRTSLLPLVFCVPAAAVSRHRAFWVRALAAAVVAAMVIAIPMARNWRTTGELTLAHNSAYNLYIGNRDVYAEDLNLFRPVATAEQIEFRRQFWNDELAYPTQSRAQMQREAIAWMVEHPGLVARRAFGRLARVFAPKTDVLELVGGERQAGVFSIRSITLLAVANAQWLAILVAGLVGLVALWRLQLPTARLFAAALAGALPLCLIAIAKPRYAFPFEPLLLIAAVALSVERERLLSVLQRRDRIALATAIGFLAWGWIAWLIFAFSSRLALSSPA